MHLISLESFKSDTLVTLCRVSKFKCILISFGTCYDVGSIIGYCVYSTVVHTSLCIAD